jgi:prepilin-type N-terminal cleavage/methylation domain-containing protein
MRRKRAFTLIELLIVVAIIAILAAIALPNFLEAQVRSKTARAKNDLRVLATALEAYRVDQQAYPDVLPSPEDIDLGGAWLMKPLTTPVSYITSLPDDPFLPPQPEPIIGPRRTYRYTSYPISPDHAVKWSVASNGPDRGNDTRGIYQGYTPLLFYGGDPEMPELKEWVLYDPTNGSTSRGDIFRACDYVPN